MRGTSASKTQMTVLCDIGVHFLAQQNADSLSVSPSTCLTLLQSIRISYPSKWDYTQLTTYLTASTIHRRPVR